MNDLLVKLFGWRATFLHGDPTVWDRFRWLQHHIRPGPLTTLDAGCGSGAFTLYAASLGNRSIGLSSDEKNMETAWRRSRLAGVNGTEFSVVDLRYLDRWKPASPGYDQILCFECIEHILDDSKLIRDLAYLLKPGGHLLLTTPYEKYRPLFGDDPTKLSEVEDGGHVRWGYSFERIAELFEKSGLDVLAQEFISGFVSQKLTSLMRRVSSTINHPVAWVTVFPLRCLQVTDRIVTKLLKYPYLSIGVLGVKRETQPPVRCLSD